MNIRTISKNNYSSVKELIQTAFSQTKHGYTDEGELVEKIRKQVDYKKNLEIIAEIDSQIVGHALLSEVILVTKDSNINLTGLCLAPISVDPNFQKQGIGSKMIDTLESRAQEYDYPFISILGHPEYYEQFNYIPAHLYNIKAPFEVPKEAYLIKELFPNSLKNYSGTIQYSKAFQ